MKIKRCGECPFYYTIPGESIQDSDQEYCNLGVSTYKVRLTGPEKKAPPTECPLYLAPVIVEIDS